MNGLAVALQFAQCARHNPVPRIQLSWAEIPGSPCCIAVSTFLGVRLPYIFVCLSHYYMFRPTCVASTGSLQILAKKCDLGCGPSNFNSECFVV